MLFLLFLFLLSQMVKNPPAKQDTRVPLLGGDNPLKKGMATHSCILAWKALWTEEPGGLQSMGLQRVGHDLVTEEQSLVYKKNKQN